MPNDNLPSYAELMEREEPPRGASWGLFGEDDQLGMMNFLTPERTAAAARLVQRGDVFPLDLPLHLPDPPLFGRGAYKQTIYRRTGERLGHDDSLDNFFLQASSQWDSLAHVGHPKFGLYNGVQADDVTGEEGSKNGIDAWVKRGIAGRGLLLDVARHLEAQGNAIDAFTTRSITAAELDATAAAQGVEVEAGDIVLVRTGFESRYMAASRDEREALASDLHAPGLEGSAEMAAWLWDHRVAAVASDCPALEAWPWPAGGPSLHVLGLCFLGLALGELWSLDALAADCARDSVYAFLLTSSPLHIRGGVGSPPNAMAIK